MKHVSTEARETRETKHTEQADGGVMRLSPRRFLCISYCSLEPLCVSSVSRIARVA